MILIVIWVLINKFILEYNLLTLLVAKPVILPLDDGGGMSPEAMRRCMSFGFSEKKSKSAIGQCMESSINSTVSFEYLP
jgi:hypothetical protein